MIDICKIQQQMGFLTKSMRYLRITLIAFVQRVAKKIRPQNKLLQKVIKIHQFFAQNQFCTYLPNSQNLQYLQLNSLSKINEQLNTLYLSYHSVISASFISSKGKSCVAITIDLPLRPALKAILQTSLKRLSISPRTPSRAAKGGTAPGSTPKFFTYSSLHMRPFFISSTFRSLLQLIFLLARQSSRVRAVFPVTSMVLEPHSRGVFLSSADSLDVRVAECSITSNLMLLDVRYCTILLKVSSLYLESSEGGLDSISFSIFLQVQFINLLIKIGEETLLNQPQQFDQTLHVLRRMSLAFQYLLCSYLLYDLDSCIKSFDQDETKINQFLLKVLGQKFSQIEHLYIYAFSDVG